MHLVVGADPARSCGTPSATPAPRSTSPAGRPARCCHMLFGSPLRLVCTYSSNIATAVNGSPSRVMVTRAATGEAHTFRHAGRHVPSSWHHSGAETDTYGGRGRRLCGR